MYLTIWIQSLKKNSVKRYNWDIINPGLDDLWWIYKLLELFFLINGNPDGCWLNLSPLPWGWGGWGPVELMLLGFISLLLTVFQSVVASLCMPERLSRTMLPCKYIEQPLAADAAGAPMAQVGEGFNDSRTIHARRLFQATTDQTSPVAPPSICSLVRCWWWKYFGVAAKVCDLGRISLIKTRHKNTHLDTHSFGGNRCQQSWCFLTVSAMARELING
jgi:hypothetical protein